MGAIIHRIADIPGGVTISTRGMVKGSVIPEGTPLYYDSITDKWCLDRRAKIFAFRMKDADCVEVYKGHGFVIGDKLEGPFNEPDRGIITKIDTSHPDKDIIYFNRPYTEGYFSGEDINPSDGPNSKELGYLRIESTGAGYAKAVLGENTTVTGGLQNVSAWVIAVLHWPGDVQIVTSGIIYI